MADIFISYSKAHRSVTEELAQDLEAKGFSIWWDTALVSGDSFREVILAELAKTRAAIVIWTAASVKSDWVISEANRARARRILIPLRDPDLNPDDIPPPFDALHTEVVSNRAAILAALAKLGVVPPAPQRSPEPARAPLSEAPVGEALALDRWQSIKDNADTRKLREFLSEFGAAEVARLARDQLLALEAAAWARLPKKRVVETLRNFLAEFPDGPNAKAAQAELALLQAAPPRADAMFMSPWSSSRVLGILFILQGILRLYFIANSLSQMPQASLAPNFVILGVIVPGMIAVLTVSAGGVLVWRPPSGRVFGLVTCSIALGYQLYAFGSVMIYLFSTSQPMQSPGALFWVLQPAYIALFAVGLVVLLRLRPSGMLRR